VSHGTISLGHVLKLMPRAQVASWDQIHRTGRPSRVLRRWSPCGALVCAQVAGRHSLRDVVTAMASPSAALALLGVPPPQRSTLAEANERRPAALDQSRFTTLYARCRALAPGHGCRCNNPLFSVDRTTLSRCLHLFPWARFRTATGAIKVPTRLAHAGHLPAFVVITEGKRSDIAIARGLELPRGSLVAMDRGDIDDQFFFRLTQDGVYCVTRQQVNAQFKVTARLAIDGLRGVTADQHVVLQGPHGAADPETLRRVGSRAPDTGQPDVFWTTAFHLAAATMAAIDKERWQVELFLKVITQNLKLKTFWGTSEHAVMTPIGVALITYLILAFLRFKSGLGLSFQQWLRLLHINRFDRRNRVDLFRPPQRPTPGDHQPHAA
jgi:Domain of unknown function (DUF4372)/Transposase DDE domain